MDLMNLKMFGQNIPQSAGQYPQLSPEQQHYIQEIMRQESGASMNAQSAIEALKRFERARAPMDGRDPYYDSDNQGAYIGPSLMGWYPQ